MAQNDGTNQGFRLLIEAWRPNNALQPEREYLSWWNHELAIDRARELSRRPGEFISVRVIDPMKQEIARFTGTWLYATDSPEPKQQLRRWLRFLRSPSGGPFYHEHPHR